MSCEIYAAWDRYAPTSAERIQSYVDAFFAEVPCATMMKSAEGHSILEFLDGLEP